MDCDVAIVGAGHSGLLLAAALAGTGARLRLIDPSPADPSAASDGRNLALVRGSRQLMEELGVWPAVAAVAEPVHRVIVVDRVAGTRLEWRAEDHGGEPFAFGVEHGHLRAALARALVASRAEVGQLPARLIGLERAPRRIELALADGSRLAARLVVGCDGRGSRVRELAGIGLDRWTYGQAALTFIVRTARDAAGTIREWLRPAGPLALLSLPGERTGVTWVEPEPMATALARLPEAELLRRLAEETDGFGYQGRLESAVSVWPLSAQHARRYVAPRLVLVGDAAHGVHPIHAQGFNMAVADVAVLARLLRRALRRGGDPGAPELLLAYERARRPGNRQRIWMTDGFARIFAVDRPVLRPLRIAAMELVARVPWIARFAVGHGTRLL
ncbi:2-octaprenylphenol hydroxylase [bacterium HR40]|nr:2-octaprenylphenol hydroxylase [bacterium HR40]